MSKAFVIETMQRLGRENARQVQENAPDMDGTQLYDEGGYIPEFAKACAQLNMLMRPIGFVCKSAAGRVVRLLQHYDSNVFTQEPEELPAQWGFVWSNDPKHALPFVAISTSPYMKGNCCTEGGKTYRSTFDNNVWAPSAYPQGWEAIA